MKNRLKLSLIATLGRLANLAGLPCFVRAGFYRSPALDVAITVRASDRYTVVCVNGVDVYFYRLTGAFDGAGITQSGGCTADGT